MMTDPGNATAGLRHDHHEGSLTMSRTRWLVILSVVLQLLVAVRAEEAVKKEPPAPWWLVRPWHTEPQILSWAKQHAELVTLDREQTYQGRTAYAITVTNPATDLAGKQKLLFSQPHTHEPAATAAMMNVLAQLLDGRHLDGRPSDLPRQAILDRALLTFIPDGNPDGRARAPEDWWDGTKYPNDEFGKFMFGRKADGGRFQRVDRWSNREFQPAFIGIAYEQINDHEYVEPNRDRESSFFQLVLRNSARYGYGYHLDLHQTEFEKSKYNAQMILPCLQNELPPELRDRNQRLAEAIVEAWGEAGAEPMPKVAPLAYGEDQLRYFRRCWGDIYRARCQVSTEVQNNNVRTPPRKQMELEEIAIRTAIEFALRGNTMREVLP